MLHIVKSEGKKSNEEWVVFNTWKVWTKTWLTRYRCPRACLRQLSDRKYASDLSEICQVFRNLLTFWFYFWWWYGICACGSPTRDHRLRLLSIKILNIGSQCESGQAGRASPLMMYPMSNFGQVTNHKSGHNPGNCANISHRFRCSSLSGCYAPVVSLLWTFLITRSALNNKSRILS